MGNSCFMAVYNEEWNNVDSYTSADVYNLHGPK